MTAATIPPTGFTEENGDGSDSDINDDELPEYYQPISVNDDTELDNDSDRVDSDNDLDSEPNRVDADNGHHTDLYTSYLNLANGVVQAENGMASVHISESADQKTEPDEEEEEEEERMREASESAIQRAFSEDETRRNAPLPSENATRVMEAMQGISFRGVAPDWANQVPEDQWVDHLRRLRQPQRSTGTV